MRIFTFWTPLLLAGAILSFATIGAGIPAKTLDAGWWSNIATTCANNREQCFSVSVHDKTIGIWDGKAILVKAQRGREDAAVALIDSQVTGLQRYFVTVAADASSKGVKK